MKNLIQTVCFKLLSAIILAVAGLLVILYCFQYAPAQKKQLRAGLFDKVKTVISLSGNTLTKAILTRDDIAMLASIESIMNIEDVSAAYILDNGCRVITHDKTAEWGKTYTDELSKNAVEAKKILRQATPYGFLFSQPLTSSATLCVGISSQKLEDSVSLLYREIFFTGLIIFVVSAAGFFWFVNNALALKFKKLGDELRSLELGGGGRLPEDGTDGEFGRLIKQINGVLNICNSAADGARDTQKEKNLNLIINELVNITPAAVIIIGNDNKIISLSRLAAGFLGVDADEAKGMHVLDALNLPEITTLLKQVSEKPGGSAESIIRGKKGKAIASKAGVVIQIDV
jgi:hypothetical protein